MTPCPSGNLRIETPSVEWRVWSPILGNRSISPEARDSSVLPF